MKITSKNGKFALTDEEFFACHYGNSGAPLTKQRLQQALNKAIASAKSLCHTLAHKPRYDTAVRIPPHHQAPLGAYTWSIPIHYENGNAFILSEEVGCIDGPDGF